LVSSTTSRCCPIAGIAAAVDDVDGVGIAVGVDGVDGVDGVGIAAGVDGVDGVGIAAGVDGVDGVDGVGIAAGVVGAKHAPQWLYGTTNGSLWRMLRPYNVGDAMRHGVARRAIGATWRRCGTVWRAAPSVRRGGDAASCRRGVGAVRHLLYVARFDTPPGARLQSSRKCNE
jgi:hypothetical protein